MRRLGRRRQRRRGRLWAKVTNVTCPNDVVVVRAPGTATASAPVSKTVELRNGTQPAAVVFAKLFGSSPVCADNAITTIGAISNVAIAILAVVGRRVGIARRAAFCGRAHAAAAYGNLVIIKVAPRNESAVAVSKSAVRRHHALWNVRFCRIKTQRVFHVRAVHGRVAV